MAKMPKSGCSINPQGIYVEKRDIINIGKGDTCFPIIFSLSLFLHSCFVSPLPSYTTGEPKHCIFVLVMSLIRQMVDTLTSNLSKELKHTNNYFYIIPA